ncbi:MAG: Hsp20/alpha crystallin family protein [Comamonas sp.]|jgi:HSP20 family molecular chaperone IbpA|uniref:Hsp20/alpha crystallin family protein n=1 Tax=Comamonas sp. TaxID=34028 RepID=UPI002818F610|nr:Hsp20/alpha crystallin family protein [Comamonas sp.]MDR0213022.1 Hsp20/alpha crystallin family protein [Comamonas sp.]
MIFAPVMSRNTFVSPRAADLALQRFLQGTLGAASPVQQHVQVSRDDKATTLSLDVPGLAREQLKLSIEGAVVRLESAEGASRQVKRAWELDHEIDAAASKAKLEHGVLTLTLAKLEPQSKATELTIE